MVRRDLLDALGHLRCRIETFNGINSHGSRRDVDERRDPRSVARDLEMWNGTGGKRPNDGRDLAIGKGRLARYRFEEDRSRRIDVCSMVGFSLLEEQLRRQVTHRRRDLQGNPLHSAVVLETHLPVCLDEHIAGCHLTVDHAKCLALCVPEPVEFFESCKHIKQDSQGDGQRHS